MKQVFCFGCGCPLSSEDGGAPSESLNYVWIESEISRTRIPFCGVCDLESQSVIDSSISRLKKTSPEICLSGTVTLKKGVTLDEYISMATGDICSDCGKTVSDDRVRVGWKLFHKKCAGIYEDLFKPENKTYSKKA